MASLEQPQRATVLYVGNSRDNRAAIFRVVDRLGCGAATACCYREALSWINRNRFALVFCEQRLPDGRWLDLLSRFAEITEPPALVVLSQVRDSGSWAEAINLGAQDVLLTPILDGELQHVAGSALHAWPLQS